MPKYIPSQPVISLRSMLAGERLHLPADGLFSCARYGLLFYLDYLSESRPHVPRRILLPDYMCRDVGQALERRGYESVYYPLAANLDLGDEARSAMAAQGPHCLAMVLGHFYGRLSRDRAEVARWCLDQKLPLIEDCVHFPFPHHAAGGDGVPSARLYSLRKVYAVPHGGVVVAGQDQDAFARFLARRRLPVSGETPAALADWTIRQAAKKALLLMKMGYAPPRREGGEDLPSFTHASPLLRRLLPGRVCEEAIRRRKRNYARYMAHRESLAQWGDVLPLDGEGDVPYMFVIFLNEHYDAARAAGRLEAFGIPAGTGLALDPAVLSSLSGSHPYRRILTLPLHQDIDAEHIAYIAGLLEDPATRAEARTLPAQATAGCVQAIA